MKQSLVILNGIRFPFNLVNSAIEWTIEHNTRIHALFVKATDEVKEGYIFPSDLDSAQKIATTQDSEDASINVIKAQMKLLEDMTKHHKLKYSADLLTDPPLDDIIKLTKNSEILFLDGEDDQLGALSVNSFSYKDLMNQSLCPVELIYN